MTVLVRFFTSGYAPGEVQAQAVSDRITRRIVRDVVANGGPDEEAALLSWDDAETTLTPKQLRELDEWGEVTVKMDEWELRQYYGYASNPGGTMPFNPRPRGAGRRVRYERGYNDIRPYGPGKFNTILDSYVYEWIGIVGGGDSSEGDVSEFGEAYELVRRFTNLDAEDVAKLAREGGEPLTQDEKRYLRDHQAFILSENDQGFVTIDFYRTSKEADEAWSEIEEHFEKLYEEREGDEE